ncbi:MAG: hypothetical protein P0Y56_01500 [Candidatus Andeanibacterium colombiense]|uniref:Secreted protein n=1 Tax=Candidatus Andeanibacterium colombiense TaxID=3121345 RepID=A0AAJ6BPT6_9SPHN|nr:MAG: hypothetical protein P0Y56_01500 [Sphingomonadaceae bacterium]
MRFPKSVALLALVGLTASQGASAQQQCVSGSEIASLFVYAVPPTLEAVKNSCDGQLAPDGFFARGSTKLSARYVALQNDTWPKARRALLMAIASQQNKNGKKTQVQGLGGVDPLKMAEALPDNVARPLVETLIMQKVAEKVKPDQCRTLERIFGAMAPFDPRDAGMLLGVAMPLVGLKDPKVCDDE